MKTEPSTVCRSDVSSKAPRQGRKHPVSSRRVFCLIIPSRRKCTPSCRIIRLIKLVLCRRVHSSRRVLSCLRDVSTRALALAPSKIHAAQPRHLRARAFLPGQTEEASARRPARPRRERRLRVARVVVGSLAPRVARRAPPGLAIRRARAADEKRVPVGAPAAFGPSAASRADAARREARRAVVERGVRVRERPRGAQALRVAVGGKVARGSEPRAGTRRARAAERPVILRANLAEAREHADALRAQGHEHDQGADADGAGPRVLFVDVDARVVPVRDGLKGRDGAAGRKVEHVRRLVHARDEHQPPVEALQHAVVVGPGRGEARLVRQREGGGIQD